MYFHIDAGPYAYAYVTDQYDLFDLLHKRRGWPDATAMAAIRRLASGATDSLETGGLTITYNHEEN